MKSHGERAAIPSGPLAGITVVALEQAVSAPLCSRTLADLGARVIKVENPRGGDFTRDYDEVVHGMSSYFVWLNRGKESVALDVKGERGRQLLHRLLARADVVVSNLAPGATTRLGVDGDQLRARYPRLVSLEISGYGAGGPLSAKRAYDLLVQAEGGVCAITGWPDQPAKPGPPVADCCTGVYGALTVLAALHERHQTGQGATCSVSLFDAVTELMGYPLTYTRYAGVDHQPVGMGSPAVAPYGAYRTGDGQTVVLGTTNDAEWQRLSAMIERPDLGADVRYRRNSGRVRHREELDRALAAWCAEGTLEHIQRSADAAGIGNARYNTPSEVLAHPQLAERGRWREVDSPVGPLTALVPPPVIGDHPPLMGGVPALGEHSEAVLGELGLTMPEIDDLVADGIIARPGSKSPDGSAGDDHATSAQEGDSYR